MNGTCYEVQIGILLDGCVICVGNPDKKFGPLVEARKGSFMDSSGMYWYACMLKLSL